MWGSSFKIQPLHRVEVNRHPRARKCVRLVYDRSENVSTAKLIRIPWSRLQQRKEHRIKNPLKISVFLDATPGR